MSRKRPTDLELMLYADGELNGEEAARVSAYLAQDPQARAVVDGVHEVGEVVRTFVEVEADLVEDSSPAFHQLWDRVQRSIQANGAAAARPEAPAAAAAPERARGERRGAWAAMRRWFEDHRGYVLTGAVSAGVVAALMLAVGPRTRVVERHVVGGGVVGTPAALRVKSEPPEVEDLEVYEGSGTILTIEPDADDDSAAAVIWISNDQDDQEEPI